MSNKSNLDIIALAKKYSKGNNLLENLLLTCWKKNVRTFAIEDGNETNTFPFLGLIIDNESIICIKKIILHLQNIPNLGMSARIRYTYGNTSKLLESPYPDDSCRIFIISYKNNNKSDVYNEIINALNSDISNPKLSNIIHDSDFPITAQSFYDFIVKLCNTPYDKIYTSYENNRPIECYFQTEQKNNKSKTLPIISSAVKSFSKNQDCNHKLDNSIKSETSNKQSLKKYIKSRTNSDNERDDYI